MRKEFKIIRAITLTERKNRKIASVVLAVLCLIFLFVNFSLFQDTRVSTCVGTRTERTGLIYEEPLVQKFVPSARFIEYMELHFADCNSEEGDIIFTIENSKGEELYREVVPISSLSGDVYYKFNINMDVRKGGTYYFKVLSSGVDSYHSPKVWLSNNIKDEVRDVIFRGQDAEKRLQTNVEIGYAQFHYFSFIIAFVCFGLSCATILFQININEEWKHRIGIYLLLTMPIFMYLVVESLNGVSILKANPAVWIVNYVLYLIIYLVFFAITNKLRFTVLFSNIIIFILGIANFYKLEFRGEPFSLSDFASLSTAANVASEYTISLHYMIVVSAAIFMLITAVVSRFRYSMPNIRVRLLVGVLSLSFAVLLVTALFNTDRYSASKDSLMKRLGIVNNVWNQPKNYTDNGVLVAIAMNAKYLTVSAPSVYSLDNMQHIADDVRDNYGMNMNTKNLLLDNQRNMNTEKDMPNIICIMDESYSDFSQFGDIELTQEYAPFINSLYDRENAIRGDLFVSTYGGGTANSEFEFLTGNTMLGVPNGSIPYQQFIDSEATSLARTLGHLGYYSVALHPYIASGWNRPAVYNYMGFNEFLSQDDFPDADYIRSYISDECSFEKIIELYEQRNEVDDAPLFLFNVTMQNHGSYSKSYSNFEPDVFYAPNPGAYPEAEQYLSVARNTDSAVEMLVNYFENCDEPTIICFFGDHLPSFHDGFYEDMLGVLDTAQLEPAEMQKLYMTDFFIWANYDIPEYDIHNISLNYLSTLLMQVAGVPMTQYQLFLTNMYCTYPIVTTLGLCDFDGNYVCGTGTLTSTDLWNYYSVLEYNNIFEDDNRYCTFFDFPYRDAMELENDHGRKHSDVYDIVSEMFEIDVVVPDEASSGEADEIVAAAVEN